MYRTGDLTRCRENGHFEYLGRLDDQVKIRGYRIELGEIEAGMLEHPAIHRSVVMAREDEPGNKQLVGYAIQRKGDSVTPKDLQEFLKQKLPAYMVPSCLVFVDAFQLTPNGKVDRRALPPPRKVRSQRVEFMAPRNQVEAKLAAIWEELLGVSPIGLTDNFFELGGHSLLVAKLLVRIEQLFGKRLSMATLFEAPTIGQLTPVLRDQVGSSSRVIPIQPDGSSPPFFCFGAGPLFRPLADRLGTARPFLSLMPTDDAELKKLSPPYRLEDIAGHAAKTILEYRPEGPYYLGGWSASGVVAYETGRQLADKGHEVALLVLFDTLNPAMQQSHETVKKLQSRFQKMKFFARELRELRLRNIDRYLLEKAQGFRDRVHEAAFKLKYATRARVNGGRLENSEHIIRVALEKYRPRPYSGRVAFFNAAARPAGSIWDFSEGWQHLTKEFEVHEVPGDHHSMFLEPNVDSLASKLRGTFDKFSTAPITGELLARRHAITS
jgi:thioesterase domain-containing protein/acyl carrier protein